MSAEAKVRFARFLRESHVCSFVKSDGSESLKSLFKKSDRAKSDRAKSDRAKSDRAKSERAKSERTKSERAKEQRAKELIPYPALYLVYTVWYEPRGMLIQP